MQQTYRTGLNSIDDLTSFFHATFTTLEEQNTCVIMVLERGKTLEYGEQGIIRQSFGCVVEWVAVAKVLLWAGDFWRMMLEEQNLMPSPRTKHQLT